jgi:methyl-accepting chemotaxis protein
MFQSKYIKSEPPTQPTAEPTVEPSVEPTVESSISSNNPSNITSKVETSNTPIIEKEPLKKNYSYRTDKRGFPKPKCGLNQYVPEKLLAVSNNLASKLEETWDEGIDKLEKGELFTEWNAPNQRAGKEQLDPKTGKPLKCNGILNLIDKDCFDKKSVKVVDASRDAATNITNAAIHFALTTGAVGLNRVLDIFSTAMLGLKDGITMENKEEVLNKLEEKLVLMQYLANDEKSKNLIKKMFASLAIMVMDGSEAAREPLLKTFNDTVTSTVEGVNVAMRQASKFAKNAVKIIPGIGDAYIILDSALAIGIAVSGVGKVLAKNAKTVTEQGDTALTRIKEKLNPKLKKLEDNIDEINAIKEKINNIDINAFLKQAESKIGNTIKDAGDIASNAILTSAADNNIVKSVANISSGLTNSVNNAKNIVNNAKNIKNNARVAANNAVNNAVNNATNAATNAVENVTNKATNALENAANNAVNNVTNATTNISNKAQATKDNIKNTKKGFFGRSPKRGGTKKLKSSFKKTGSTKSKKVRFQL